MFKRLLFGVAVGAMLIACTPAGGSSPGATVAPTVAAPSESMPSESMPAESASPSAS
jgi:hypothetical protein